MADRRTGNRGPDRRRIVPPRSRVGGVSVLLASASPRRRELLARLDVHPIVRASGIAEYLLEDEEAAVGAERLARAKVDAVPHRGADLTIAADTIVVVDGLALGKPADGAEATDMLTRLSGRDHEVITGIAVRRGDVVETDHERTVVRFRDLSDQEVEWYVRSGDPLDKAGSYGLQGAAAAFVDRIEGSDTNVIGLPLATLVLLSRRIGVDFLTT